MVDAKFVEMGDGSSPQAAMQVGPERLFQAIINQSLQEARSDGTRPEATRTLYSEDERSSSSIKKGSLADYAGTFLRFSNETDRAEGAMLEHMQRRISDDRQTLQTYASAVKATGRSDFNSVAARTAAPLGGGHAASSTGADQNSSEGDQISNQASFRAGDVFKTMEKSAQRHMEMNSLTTEFTLTQNARKLETEMMIWKTNDMFRRRSSISEMTNSIIKQVSDLFGRLTQG